MSVFGADLPSALLKNEFELSLSFCRNSYASPCHEFVPDFVRTSTTAPPALPNSAGYKFVRTTTCLLELMFTGCRMIDSDESSLLTPSVWKAVARLPLPL